MDNLHSDNAPSPEEVTTPSAVPPMDRVPEFDADDSKATPKPKAEPAKGEEVQEPDAEEGTKKPERETLLDDISKSARARQRAELDKSEAALSRPESGAPTKASEEETPKTIRRKINGEVREFTQEEYDTAAMKNLAGDDRLEEAKRKELLSKEKDQELAELRQKMARLEGRFEGTQKSEAPPVEQEPTPDPVKEAREAVNHATHYGTDEEIAAAQEVLNEAESKAWEAREQQIRENASRDAIAQVENTQIATATKAETYGTLTEIGGTIPQVLNDPMIKTSTRENMHGRTAEVLVRYVSDPKTPEHVRAHFESQGINGPDQLLQSLKTMSPTDLHQTYNTFKHRGHALPTLRTVMQLAAVEVAKHFNLLPAPPDSAPSGTEDKARPQSQGDTQPAVAVDRSSRKAALENRPGRTGVPRSTETGRQKPTEEQRKKRGFAQVSNRKGRKIG